MDSKFLMVILLCQRVYYNMNICLFNSNINGLKNGILIYYI